MISHEDELKINGSGLFSRYSDLTNEKKLEIFKWHEKQSENTKRYIDLLLTEARDDARYEESDDLN